MHKSWIMERLLVLCCFLLLPELYKHVKGTWLVLRFLFKLGSLMSTWMHKTKFLLARLISCMCFLVGFEDVLDVAVVLTEAWMSVTFVCCSLVSLCICCPFQRGVVLVTRAS